MPSAFRTEALHGYSCKWSPFNEALLAVATSQYYGVVGNGRLLVLAAAPDSSELTPTGPGFETQEGQYDVCWSELNERHLVSSCGDGTLKLWDHLGGGGRPLLSFQEHQAEAYACDWNLVAKNVFASGSWDDTVKVWTPERAQSVCTFAEHQRCVYGVAWSPYHAPLLASCAGDGTLKLWDIGAPASTLTITAHEGEVLSCDWSRYNDWQLVSGSVDKTVKVWDIRSPAQPVHCLYGHAYAVRRVRCSPHHANVLASCSYDMTLRLWDMGVPEALVETLEHHTEFTVGVDFNMFREGQIASCSWDETVHTWNHAHGDRPQRT